MERFYSTDHMLAQYLETGWRKKEIAGGREYLPPESFASGFSRVFGDTASHCVIYSDMVLNRNVIERFYFKERGFQISFIESMTGMYYEKNTQRNELHDKFGMFCHVNAVPRPWFHRYPAGTAQKVISIMLLESFFTKSGIPLPPDAWETAAAVLNSRPLSLPPLAALCQELKSNTGKQACTSLFLHAKCAEAASLLLEYVYTRPKSDTVKLSVRSRRAAMEALFILNEAFIQPPTVEVLAQMTGVDKKTLHKAFLQITGQSVHDYICSLRMEKAVLLLDQPLTIEEISLKTGYQSKIHFYKAFKNAFGCTPNEMRSAK